VLVADQSPVFSRMPDAAFASTALVQAAAWTIGIAVRTQRAYASGLKEQAEQRVRAETDRSRRALAEERLRIARELHDVIAHTMSVIAVQASVGAHVIDAHPAEGRATLRTIEQATHGALHELRSMLNVLRDSDGTTATGISLAPAPSLVDLPALIDQTRQTGLAIEVATVGSPRVLAPSIELATYRIVQEALTNVVRHANAQHARVELAYRRSTLDVTVTDDGHCVLPTQAVDGHGVIGMRERVALHGGQFTAGPLQSRGFRIHAVLPVGGGHEQP
jgi:signal transduction histidine kinase